MKFGQLIFRNIIKVVATRCQILRLKCTKFDFGWGSAPDPARELTALPQTLYIDLRGPTSKGGKGGEGKGDRGEGWDAEKGKGREGEKGNGGQGKGGQRWEGKFRGPGGKERGREKGRGGKI